MKLSIITIIIFSFLAIAVLGAMFMMPHGNHSEGVACIASLAKGSVCPKGDVFASLAFHVSAFKNFSTAVLVNGGLALVLLSFAFLLYTTLAVLSKFYIVSEIILNFNTRYRHLSELVSIPPKQEFTYWFSLHENSPTTS